MIRRLINWFKEYYMGEPKKLSPDVEDSIRKLGHEDTLFYSEQLLNNPVLRALFEKMESEAMLFWKETPTTDLESREGLYLFVRTIGKIRGRLEMMINEASGELAMLKQEERINAMADGQEEEGE